MSRIITDSATDLDLPDVEHMQLECMMCYLVWEVIVCERVCVWFFKGLIGRQPLWLYEYPQRL